MENRIITMDSLVAFCKANKTFSFSAKEVGHPLVVSTFGDLQYSPANDEGLMQVVLKSCHTGLNRNGSFISDDNMTRALPSFANKPILAEIRENSKGELDFGTHAMDFIEDEDGNIKIHYIERPVGIVPESNNAHLEYDKEQDKTYAIVDGYIFKYYGNETAEILERKKGTKVSVEIEIYEMAWNAKKNYLEINDFIFDGVTLLSEDVGEGMLGSRLDISDFSQYSSFDYSKEINEMKSRLLELEQRFSNKNSKEGGKDVSKFEELLAQYGKTVEDIDFEYEGLSDEELEAKFAEVFGEDDPTSSEGDDNSTDEPENPDNNKDDNKDDDKGSTDELEEPKSSETPKTRGDTKGGGDSNDDDDSSEGIPVTQKDDDDTAGSTKKTNSFELSLQQKINALSNLVEATYEDADNEWYSTLVYDEYVVMVGYFHGRAYKQSYKEENDEYSLVGDRVEVFAQYLTQDEMDALDNMRSSYSELVEYKANIEKSEKESAIDKLINDERFNAIHDSEAYNQLCEKKYEFSLEELEKELKLIVADNVLGNSDFSFSKQPSGRMFTIPAKSTNSVESKYGGIFSKK